MPRLEEVPGKLDFTQGAEDSWMDFSALKNVFMSRMAGTWIKYAFFFFFFSNTVLFI